MLETNSLSIVSMSALLYARVSTERQAEHDLSIPAQVRILKEHAARCGIAIAGIYSDVGTGRSMAARDQLRELIGRCKRESDIDVVLVHRMDRLNRNLFEYVSLKSKLKKCGVRIMSVMEPIEQSPVGELIENIMAAHAEFYSANLALEVKKGLEERLRRGQWNAKPPIGYLRLADGTIVLDPARAPRIKLAFERWASGEVTSTQLADELWRAGLVSINGKRLYEQHVCRILHNPFYVGRLQTRSGVFPGKHEPLISEELFEQATQRFAERRTAPRYRRHHFALARRLACSVCSRTLVGDETTKKSGKAYRYYRCHTRGCSNIHRAEELEALYDGSSQAVIKPCTIQSFST